MTNELIATRLNTDVGNWAPVAQHYEVNGGHLVVVVNQFLTAEGTDVFYVDELGGPFKMQPIVQFPVGTTHTQALEQMGYTVIDNIVETVVDASPEEVEEEAPDSIMDILPPEISQVVENFNNS